jgi:hypothetical protein
MKGGASWSRRELLRAGGAGLGAMALHALLAERAVARSEVSTIAPSPHHAPRAKRVVHLHMAGAPSQLDLFDPKPKLRELDGQPVPASYLAGERFAFIKGHPKLLGSPFEFARHGESGAEFSALLPHLAKQADRLLVARSMRTTQFNHAPAQIYMASGHERIGRPSFGSWTSYGLGAANRDLPAYCVLLSGRYGPDGGASLWSSGFLPTVHQGVRLRGEGAPVLHLEDPEGLSRESRRAQLDTLAELNARRRDAVGDPEIATRMAQYELAWRMQTSVPELADLSRESAATLARYGAEPGRRSFANNCLLARRLLERGVRFVQLYHWGWDSHGTGPDDDLTTSLPRRALETDRPSAALLEDLAQSGLLEDTLFVWGGEFGRTPMNEERNGSKFLGRDHHPHAFTLLLSGGGLKTGQTWGATDELGYRVVADPVSVHDLHATLLHCLGFDHEKLVHRSQGRDFRLTDVEGEVVRGWLA